MRMLIRPKVRRFSTIEIMGSDYIARRTCSVFAGSAFLPVRGRLRLAIDVVE